MSGKLERHKCKIDGCEKIAWYATIGYCMSHHRRWKLYGDPMGGHFRRGVAMRYIREVVLAYEGDECLTWPYAYDSNGYGRIGVGTASRVVCIEAHGPPPSPVHQAAHSCGRGRQGCVTKGHLSWKTPLENSADQIRHGGTVRGSKNFNAKLTEADVHQIRALRRKLPSKDIADMFGVSPGTIGSVCSGKTWGWLSTQEIAS